MVVKIKEGSKKNIINDLSFLYGKKEAPYIYKRLEKLIKKYSRKIKNENSKKYFDEKDVVLITYGDNIIKGRNHPLKTLSLFLNQNLKSLINTVHIIGLFLYSSDRGFSIIDYKKINPRLGDLKDLKCIKENFKIMVDFVCNHMSSKGQWFKKFSKGNAKYKDFFISFDEKPEKEKMEKVFRPRTSSLFIYRKIANKRKWLWRTFHHDQIDLNYKNPEVLLNMIDVFLFYLENGAEFIRLDAIAYIWKELETSCFLTKESHVFVQLLRKILDVLSPSNDLVAEINTGFKENIKYLGNGKNEAQIIYNFPLPGLVLHAFYNKNSEKILNWLGTVKLPSKKTTLFNVLDCHDGISAVGLDDILNQKGIKNISKNVLKSGGVVGYKTHCQEKESPYEFNITWWNAINGNNKGSEDLKIKKYIATRALSFSLKGIPTIYFLGLFGIENCIMCFKKSGKNRDLNRRNFSERQINYFLENNDKKENKVFKETCKLLKIRNKEKAFHPAAHQKILKIKKSIFSIIRISTDKKNKILVLINLTEKEKTIKLSQKKVSSKNLLDIISRERFKNKNRIFEIKMHPFQARWLKY